MVGVGRASRARALGIALALGALAAGLGAARAAAQAPTEYEVKAAFIYNFTRFVEWPRETLARSEVFVIGVLGRDPFGGALEAAVRGKSVAQKEIVIRRVATAREALGSHVVFVSGSEESRLPLILRELDGASALVIGDAEGFASRGGMIELRLESSRVRFDINVEAAERAGLRVSSQLLKLARVVTGGPRRTE